MLELRGAALPQEDVKHAVIRSRYLRDVVGMASREAIRHLKKELAVVLDGDADEPDGDGLAELRAQVLLDLVAERCAAGGKDQGLGVLRAAKLEGPETLNL